MRNYVVKDAGYDKLQRRVCTVWTSRNVASELYEVLLDEKDALLIDTLSRQDEGQITIAFTPLADDINITDIRRVVSLVESQIAVTEEAEGSDQYSSDRIISILIKRREESSALLALPKAPEPEELTPGDVEEEVTKEKSPEESTS